MRLTENWRKSLDMSKLVGIVFMDLSKAFDSIPHDLLTTKLKACGLRHISKIESNVLKSKNQKVNTTILSRHPTGFNIGTYFIQCLPKLSILVYKGSQFA